MTGRSAARHLEQARWALDVAVFHLEDAGAELDGDVRGKVADMSTTVKDIRDRLEGWEGR